MAPREQKGLSSPFGFWKKEICTRFGMHILGEQTDPSSFQRHAITSRECHEHVDDDEGVVPKTASLKAAA
eukprot:scaffold180284_cov20-Tisochrysis_lutea.AAC.3